MYYEITTTKPPSQETWQSGYLKERIYITQTAKLLEQLNSENIKVVASCDFEEDL